MSDSLSHHLPGQVNDCDAFDAAVAELALEMLDASERDALLTHASSCPRCSTELQRMSVAADHLTLLAPECEPPVGFEQRVMESLSTQKVKRLRPVRPVRVWHLAAAAAALFAVGVGTGVAVHHEPAPVAGSETPEFRYADLVDAAGGNHGSVTVVADHESPNSALLTMSLVNLDAGQYHCVVQLGDGSSKVVAAWPIGSVGGGAWAVPITIAINDIRGVSVRDEAGSTIAMTNWPR